ncbi:MAG: TonB-dependent receptor plug domain-containing protein, partial [Desulfobulbaceae bacterium]|nr:TonB-dependent receptor plug domain-containing protein [Desulfobulbaceae bacterium]
MKKKKWLLATLAATALTVPYAVQAEEDGNKNNLFKLDEVVVTGTKTSHTLEDTPVTTQVVTQEEIERSGATTAGDVLSWVPGVYVKSNGFARQAVNIEGLPDNYTLVLIDGQRQTGRHANAIDLSNIPTEMIQRIEVIKGPASVLYGSDAVAGVVNIITKKAPEKSYISGSASYGLDDSFSAGDTVDSQINFGKRHDQLSYIFGAGHHSSQQMGDGYEYESNNGLSN